jgi:hypothetical protein
MYLHLFVNIHIQFPVSLGNFFYKDAYKTWLIKHPKDLLYI